jgi:hypothetical protein
VSRLVATSAAPSPAMRRMLRSVRARIHEWWRGRRDLRRGRIVTHDPGRRPSDVEVAFVPDLEPTERDVVVAGRLLAAYRRSRREEEERGAGAPLDLWWHIRSGQRAYQELLDRGDAAALAAYLCNVCRQDATRGIAQGDELYHRVRRDPAFRAYAALLMKDRLVSLAEAVGAVPPENPEQGSWGESLHLPVGELVGRVESVLGMPIEPPAVDGGILKLVSPRGWFSTCDLDAIYTAWLLRQLLAGPAAIAEIGGGQGRVAYWCWRLGFRSYTIFDLPHVNVLQGFYLSKSLPEAPVTLYGEKAGEEGEEGIRILPWHCIFGAAPRRFDLVLNQDSFPEIAAETVRAYLERITVVSRRYFLSINHESRPPSAEGVQLNVAEEVERVGGYRRLARMQYWLRRGYVAELYAVAGAGAPA